MAECRIETNDAGLVLHLGGALLMDYADQLRSLLVRSLTVSDHIEIDVASVTSVDISCLQLFCAAHRTSTSSRKRVEFLHESSAFQQAARQAGFTRSRGCMADKGIPCIWREEKDYE